MSLPRAQIVVLISHLQRPNQQSRLAQVVEGLMGDYADETSIKVLDTSVDEALQVACELERRGEVDVFVCAGATAAYLRKHLTRPVLSMRISGADLLHALEQARSHSSQVALLSYNRTNVELQAMAALFTVQIHQAAYTTLEEARRAVEKMASLGCRSIIGSSTVLEIAEQAGLHGVLSLSAETVRKALEEALGILHSQRIEIAKRQHLNGVLQHIPAGVAAVDNQGIVQSLNPALALLLDLPVSAALGRPLQELCPALDLEQALRDGIGEENQVMRLGTHQVVSNLLPILENGQRTGMVLVCQDTTAVQRADQRIRSSRRPGAFAAKYRLEQISGNSLANRELLHLAERYALTNSTILITGESGTGKELLAQGIHNTSHRPHGPFVAINCAAFPESLLESELFGYEEGAFSGSRKGGKPGLFEVAHRGTLFLDEIGDMPLPTQARLLRVLQARSIQPLGCGEPIAVDIRVVSASNRDLAAAVRAGRFRQDLYYRIAGLTLTLPPLRERSDRRALIEQVHQQYREPGQPARLTPELLAVLLAHPWPGNLRQLVSVMQVALALAGPQSINIEHLPESFLTELPGHTPMACAEADTGTEADLASLLRSAQGNVSSLARSLGISRTTLYKRLRELEVIGKPDARSVETPR